MRTIDRDGFGPAVRDGSEILKVVPRKAGATTHSKVWMPLLQKSRHMEFV